ncbi:MAG: sulfatase family protein [bacterium]|nr:MAG: sulfatase family protein [bacterium]KAF0148258.1 MAG: sulfatase family protein [bacterium]KAF0167753.1 MAG: sulfatase family protein [bacterium]TXT20118.1 MAG: sulfatase family protein [bacterium]
MRSLFSWLHSRRIRFIAAGIALFFIFFAILRAIFYFGFSGAVGQTVVPTADVLNTISIGLRFDLRVAILLMIIPGLLLVLPWINALRIKWLRYAMRVYFVLALLAMLLIAAFDFGHYQYLGTRLNATVFRFLGNAEISADMLWQSYPVIKIAFGIILGAAVFALLFLWLEKITLDRNEVRIGWPARVFSAVIVLPLMFFGILGRVTDINLENPVPLRWSDAYYTGNQQIGSLGIHPVIFLYETSRARHDSYDIEQVRKHYDVVANYLGVTNKDSAGLNYDRFVPLQPHRINAEQKPNIIFVFLESLGASRVGIYGNPLKPTPVLDDIGANSLRMEHLYVPVTGTAETVWAVTTGMPDASRGKSATRNPLIIRQQVVINALTEYTKIYAIGGSARWANMNALIKHSIPDITLYEEGYWKSRNVDVWGISDLNLFKETDHILRALPKNKPFYALIQTAGNHEPFTIPHDSDDFVAESRSEEELRQAGFRSAQQYNAVRLLDYSVGRFMKLAKEGGYFDNTIFVFFGDHNNRISTLPFLPPAFEQLELESLHVPAFIYSPRHIKPRVISEVASLVDLIPTVVSLVGVEYLNTTMGRDILQRAPEGTRAAPTTFREGTFPLIGAVTKDFLAQMNADGTESRLHDIRSDKPLENVAAQYPEEAQRLSELARGLQETARYMLFHNRVEARQTRNK